MKGGVFRRRPDYFLFLRRPRRMPLTITEAIVHEAAAVIAGIGTMTAVGVQILNGKSTSVGVGSVVANGSLEPTGVASIEGVGTVGAIGSTLLSGAATLEGVGTVVADAVVGIVGEEIILAFPEVTLFEKIYQMALVRGTTDGTPGTRSTHVHPLGKTPIVVIPVATGLDDDTDENVNTPVLWCPDGTLDDDEFVVKSDAASQGFVAIVLA